jgi:hypothetical protein
VEPAARQVWKIPALENGGLRISAPDYYGNDDYYHFILQRF